MSEAPHSRASKSFQVSASENGHMSDAVFDFIFHRQCLLKVTNNRTMKLVKAVEGDQ
jgi:hypothetical protein